MNSYGHHPDGRAHEAGYDAYDPYQDYEDTYAVDSYGADPYPKDAYGRSGSGRATASVGTAAASAAVPSGRARVAPPTDSPRPRYDWSGGSGGAPGAPGAASGRASVPVSPAIGPAAGRATVQPVGPGGPGGPGGPSGPAGTGPSGAARPARKKKRHWLRNSLLITVAVAVITAGGGMVALSYYVDSVPAPEAVNLKEGSTVLYANGKEMAALQEVNREIIDTTVPELETVRSAVVAAEDKTFYDHSGVDFAGIVRAAWNNVTGGDRQGASTIDQQYTRAAAELTEDSYSRKLKEAAMAYKLNQDHTKEEILDFYLNTIYFGRGAYGIEAAAQAYFGKTAKKLTAGEAAVVAGVIRIPDDGSTLSPYDPRHSPDNPQIAIDRWNYVLNQMVETGALDPAERAELVELPETVNPNGAKPWHKGPQGNIVRQVKYELEEMGITDVETGGYRITTTIDPKLQEAALAATKRNKNEDKNAAYWSEIAGNVRAAAVAVDPGTGAVLAYYGGNNGTGIDWAGPYKQDGEWKGGWPPGSSFKIYTLIAELREGVSMESRWDSCPSTNAQGACQYEVDYLGDPIINAGRGPTCDGQDANFCTLRGATVESLNIPFFQFSEAVPNHEGPAMILQAAKDAGITMITDSNKDGEQVHSLTAADDMSEIAPKHIDHPVAYGQYKVTVLDHANGAATLAASGVHHDAHFVKSVEERIDGEWVQIAGDRISGEERVVPQQADAITGVLTEVDDRGGFALEGGRPSAAKTGTWEHKNEDGFVDGNSAAWVIGYTPQIATAVWTGDPKNKPIEDIYGNPIGSSGLPAQIWKQFMDQAHAAKEYEFAQFPTALPVGTPDTPYATGVEPEPDNDDCRFPFFGCDRDDDDDDEDDQDNGNGNGGFGGGGGGDTTPASPDPGG